MTIDENGVSSPIRYSMVRFPGSVGLLPAIRPDGEWVKHEEAAAIIHSQAAEIERLTRERDGLVSRNAVLAADGTAARKGAANNHAALSEALEVVRPFAEDTAMCAVDSDYAAASAFLSKYGREGK